jgi:hypothetical protein
MKHRETYEENIMGDLYVYNDVEVRSDLVVGEDILPDGAETGNVGTDTYKWYRIRGKYVVQDDTCFKDSKCVMCGEDFKSGDKLIYFVHTIHPELGVMTVPIHKQCEGIKKLIDIDVPEVETKYILKPDGEIEEVIATKIEEVTEEVRKLHRDYKFDSKTGTFSKNPVYENRLMPGYEERDVYKIQPITAEELKSGKVPQKKYEGKAVFDINTNQRVINRSSVEERIMVEEARTATKDEALQLVKVKTRKPVMKKITIETGKAGV